MPIKQLRSFVLATALLVAPAANAQLLHPLFQDHGVLQRDKPIAIWGKAKPGETVRVEIAGATASARAAKDGNWRATLPALPAGGPYTLTATSGPTTQKLDDVLIGDVWLCSGQSNMEMAVSQSLNAPAEIAAANDPQLRILTIAHDSGPDPRADFKTPVSWQPVTPQSIPDFSAACYFMARDLRAYQKVPFGLIDASWGGTAVNAWRSGPSLAVDPKARDAMALLATYRTDRAKAAVQFGKSWTDWWKAGNPALLQPWQADAPGDWHPVPAFDFWEKWGVPALADYNGMVWYRTEITLTPAQAKQAATLTLGVVDDMDLSFVNDTPVGTTFMWDEFRSYPVTPGTLHAGVNRITVATIDTYGPGGMHGTPDQRALRFADGSVAPLPEPGKWQYRTAAMHGTPPHAPWETIAGMGGIYNGMIAPIGPYTLRGIAWYQGEADAEAPAGYAGRLASMISGWRTQFGDPKLPLLIAQLPIWGPRNTSPMESGFASIRDEQRRTALADPNAALAVTLDLGDVINLHPLDKQDVGHRLARAAISLVYGGGNTPSGPLATKAARAPDGIHITFTSVEKALTSYNGAPLAFELCGPAIGSCAFTPARIAGNEIVLPATAATRVRFCWGDSPVCNLTDASGIPASPFELTIE